MKKRSKGYIIQVGKKYIQVCTKERINKLVALKSEATLFLIEEQALRTIKSRMIFNAKIVAR